MKVNIYHTPHFYEGIFLYEYGAIISNMNKTYDQSTADNDIKSHYWLYIIRLEQGKYYIGTTDQGDPNNQASQYLGRKYTTLWSKKHKPEVISEVIDLGDTTKAKAIEREKIELLRLMELYGYRSVCRSDTAHPAKLPKELTNIINNKNTTTIPIVIGSIFVLISFIAIIIATTIL